MYTLELQSMNNELGALNFESLTFVMVMLSCVQYEYW